MHTSDNYEVLLANGFRRSGATIYKPHCDNCSACHAIRLSIPEVKLSKSQRRILNKGKSLRWELKDEMDDNWFDLYSRYITARHRSGTMYPPKKEEFLQFSKNDRGSNTGSPSTALVCSRYWPQCVRGAEGTGSRALPAKRTETRGMAPRFNQCFRKAQAACASA